MQRHSTKFQALKKAQAKKALEAVSSDSASVPIRPRGQQNPQTDPGSPRCQVNPPTSTWDSTSLAQ